MIILFHQCLSNYKGFFKIWNLELLPWKPSKGFHISLASCFLLQNPPVHFSPSKTRQAVGFLQLPLLYPCNCQHSGILMVIVSHYYSKPQHFSLLGVQTISFVFPRSWIFCVHQNEGRIFRREWCAYVALMLGSWTRNSCKQEAPKPQIFVCWASGIKLSAALGEECNLITAGRSVPDTSFLTNFAGDTENINIQPKLRS